MINAHIVTVPSGIAMMMQAQRGSAVQVISNQANESDPTIGATYSISNSIRVIDFVIR